MKEAVQAGIVFINTVSNGILTKDAIPPQFVLSVEDTEKKVNLHIRQEETEMAAKMTGADRSVQRHVAKIEGRGSPRAQTSEAASSSKDIQKFSEESSNLRHRSGCLMCLAMHPAACLRLRLQKLKPQKQRSKHQRHHLQEPKPKRQNHQNQQLQKQSLQGLQFRKQKLIHQRRLQKLLITEEPAQKKAAPSKRAQICASSKASSSTTNS